MRGFPDFQKMPGEIFISVFILEGQMIKMQQVRRRKKLLSGWCRIIVILPQMRWSEISVKLQICAGATNLNHRAESDIRLVCLRKTLRHGEFL